MVRLSSDGDGERERSRNPGFSREHNVQFEYSRFRPGGIEFETSEAS
jgi:hypothetical protein